MKRLLAGSMMTALTGALLMAAPQEAEACGGFFCDGGPQPMPVDQTGEDILFVMDQGQVEVHIRIEYEGEAENFAWVIPALSVPTEFNVGSQALFDAIKQATVPTYGITNQPDDCSLDDPQGFGTAGDSAGGTGAGDPTGDDGNGGGVVVKAVEQVGAFEITVIGTEGELNTQAVFDWLEENGYQQDEAARPIIEEYLQEDHDLIAIKLIGGAGVDELHPIALRFDHPEPCVPLRLTRIAAVDDMDVRTYFLADERVVPSTYKHVLVNPLKIDWPNQASNYKEVITRAVDADEADGRAFVTEYAGPSDVVQTFGVYQETWNADAFEGLDPEQVISTLTSQNLFTCGWDPNTGEDFCAGTHPLVDGLLLDYVIPEGVDPQDFYFNPSEYADQIDLDVWNDGMDFAARLRERVIEPGLNAMRLLDTHDYLSRMYTTISPDEMTKDPMFHMNPDLEEVTNIRTGTNRQLCNGDSIWTLPDGREVYVPAGDPWPNIGGDEFWEEEVDEMPAAGAPMMLVNNTEAINTALRSYNVEAGWDGEPPEPGANVDEGPEPGVEGCGCTTDDSKTGALWSAGFLFGLAALRRRKRRR